MGAYEPVVTLQGYREESIEVAKQLFYKKEVIDRVRRAATISEIERIMVQARKDA